MEGLPVTCFDKFDFDGKDAAICSRVCKHWYMMIRRIPRFVRYMYLHYVKLKDTHLLGQEISKHGLRHISPKNAMRRLEDILHTNHQFNMNMGVSWNFQFEEIMPCGMLRKFGWSGEGVVNYLEPKTGDILVVNDFYSGGFERCKTDVVDGMRFLADCVFPGTLQWKLINFNRCESTKVFGVERHRGSCFQVRFKKGPNKGDTKGLASRLRKEATYTRKRKRRERNECENTIFDAIDKKTYIVPPSHWY
jgi:hypothetical protein